MKLFPDKTKWKTFQNKIFCKKKFAASFLQLLQKYVRCYWSMIKQLSYGALQNGTRLCRGEDLSRQDIELFSLSSFYPY